MSQPMRSEQRQEIVRIFEAVLAGLNPSAEEAERIIRRQGDALVGVLRDMSRPSPEELRAELLERRSDPRSRAVKPLEEQIEVLTGYFSELSSEHAFLYARREVPKHILPEGANWFAIPKWEWLSLSVSLHGHEPSYWGALSRILFFVDATYDEELLLHTVRPRNELLVALSEIYRSQPGDIQIIAADFSGKRRKQSVALRSFTLGAVAIGSVLLTHPEWAWRCQKVLCEGDRYEPCPQGFDDCPYFYLEPRPRFAARRSSHTMFGVVSPVEAFLM